jgi:hypothetical protein
VDADVAALELKRVADGAELHINPLDKTLGGAPFFMTRSGFGMYLRHPSRWSVVPPRSMAVAPRTDSIYYMFYYGPTLKEMLEQHLTVTGSNELNVDALVPRPTEPVSSKATHVELPDVDSWDSLAALVRKLNRGSLSAILYPALDLSFADNAPADVKQRAQDLTSWVPVLFGSGAVDRATRDRWKPYWITYLREAYDRGFPLIRPLEMQFSKDPNAGRQPDVFMFGDELLLAPVVAPGGKRRLELPMGIWTDLRTNQEYKGRQTIEVDAPAGQVPMFTRNGRLFPIATSGTIELHYFPSLGGEFFLWEPAVNENSQFHASPAADYLRLESESKIQRTYEWVVHHTGAPREVKEGATSYRKVAERSQLRPNSWWHDAERNDLHVMLRAEAGSDRIINIAFPDVQRDSCGDTEDSARQGRDLRGGGESGGIRWCRAAGGVGAARNRRPSAVASSIGFRREDPAAGCLGRRPADPARSRGRRVSGRTGAHGAARICVQETVETPLARCYDVNSQL